MDFKCIPGSDSWDKVMIVDKGWSSDKKYFIETKEGSKLLLRISNVDEEETKRKDYDLIALIAETGIRMSKPVGFGRCDEESIYTLFTWVEGDDLEEVLPTLSKEVQYSLGYKAGETLSLIHGCTCEKNNEVWVVRFNRKIDRNIEVYGRCPIKFEGSDHIINYINEHRVLLNERPQVLQHGDYHVGNMVIDNGEIGIIDFNRLDCGDPWEEFNRISFSATISGEFASGMINGYFNDSVPDDFFKLLALYIGSNQLSSIPWAMKFGDDDVDYMLKQARMVLSWYDNFKSYIPNWYVSGKLKP